MAQTSKNITLDAISQLATIYMNHHRSENELEIDAECKESDYDLKITIKKSPEKVGIMQCFVIFATERFLCA